jgi:multiple sugar transport system substrate-binding protein
MRQISRRNFLQIAGIGVGAAAMAACAMPVAPAAESGGEAAAPAAEKKMMEAWSRATGLGQEVMIEMLDIYNGKNEIGAEVEFVYIAQTQGSQADEKLLTAVAGGSPPAIYFADRFTVPQFAHQGFFTNIKDFADAAGVTADQYFDFAWDETVYKDGVYALSFDTDTRGLWWNKDIFEEAGLDPEMPPTNTAELMTVTEALTQRGAGDAITRYGFNPIYDQAWLYTWGFGFGGLFQNPETKEITFSDPKNVEAMEYIKAFVDEIGVQDIDAMLAACAGSACNDQNDYFWTGQTSMTCSGNWKVAQMHRYMPDGNYGVAPMPGPDGPAPGASWAGGWSWCVPEGNKDVASAFDVCSYMCGPEGQLKYNVETAHIPTIKAAAEEPVFREDPFHAVFMDLLPVSHARPPIPFGSKLWDLQVKAFRDEIPHGLKTPEQALVDIDIEINADLEEAGFFA